MNVAFEGEPEQPWGFWLKFFWHKHFKKETEIYIWEKYSLDATSVTKLSQTIKISILKILKEAFMGNTFQIPFLLGVLSNRIFSSSV